MPPNPSQAHPGRPAFDKTAAARAGVDPEAIAPYRLDAIHAVWVATRIPVSLEPYKATLATLPTFDMATFDRLSLYTEALEFTQAILNLRAKRLREMPEIAEEGRHLRELLLAYGDVLVIKGVFVAEVIANLREGTGYEDLMGDLSSLVALYLGTPGAMGPGSAVTQAEIDRATALRLELFHAMGADRDIALSQAELVAERHKLGHLLLKAHDELRRVTEYLRYYEGDAGTLVPTLFVTGKGNRKSPEEPGEPDLAEVHEHLHAERQVFAHPEDNPFTDD